MMNRRDCLFGFAGLSVLLAGPTGAWRSGEAQARSSWADGAAPRLQGTFIQLQTAHLTWQRSDWERLFRYFAELRLSLLVVQWISHDDVEFHRAAPSGGDAASKESSIGTILDLARLHDMRVLVGLDYRSQYWEALKGGVQETRGYLKEAHARSIKLARDMLPQVQGSAAFTGWYATEEVDDETWSHRDMQQIFVSFLHSMRTQLRALTPEAPLAISGFTNARNAPQAVEAFWGAILDGAELDILMLQDGVGTGKVSLDQLPVYLSAIANAAQNWQRPLWIVPELFEQFGGPPIDHGAFRAKPATLDRVRRQLQLAAPFAQALIGFSVPEYMSPLGNLDAGRLYTAYRREVLNGGEAKRSAGSAMKADPAGKVEAP